MTCMHNRAAQNKKLIVFTFNKEKYLFIKKDEANRATQKIKERKKARQRRQKKVLASSANLFTASQVKQAKNLSLTIIFRQYGTSQPEPFSLLCLTEQRPAAHNKRKFD